jgi:hypothetical protein
MGLDGGPGALRDVVSPFSAISRREIGELDRAIDSGLERGEFANKFSPV